MILLKPTIINDNIYINFKLKEENLHLFKDFLINLKFFKNMINTLNQNYQNRSLTYFCNSINKKIITDINNIRLSQKNTLKIITYDYEFFFN